MPKSGDVGIDAWSKRVKFNWGAGILLMDFFLHSCAELKIDI